jgi:hypothetical protein
LLHLHRAAGRLALRAALALGALGGLVALGGCQHNPLLVQRSACPAVAVPNFTGDTTLFKGDGTAASDIDLVAVVTNVRGICADAGDRLSTNVSFDVIARRTATAGARTVTLPFFASVVQGGNLIVSKQVGAVTISFANGQARAQATAHAHADVDRAATLMNDATAKKVYRVRKPGDPDAATDPLADPVVKAAIRATTFEVLVGFQLSDEALAYNATK